MELEIKNHYKDLISQSETCAINNTGPYKYETCAINNTGTYKYPDNTIIN